MTQDERYVFPSCVIRDITLLHELLDESTFVRSPLLVQQKVSKRLIV